MNMKKKRILYFLVTVVLGYFTGMLAGRAWALGTSFNLNTLVPWISASCLLIALISIFLTIYFLKKSRKFHALYQMEIDDDVNETYYVQMYRNLEFGTLAFNIASVMTILALFISMNEVIILHTSSIVLGLSFPALILVAVLQKYLFKTISIVRQFDLAFFSIPKDVLDYINSYDEGERQANLEQSFRVLFQLNQYVLPGLYILIDIVSVLTGEIQLLALLAVAVVHVYINIMQIPMIKRYFK
jgi:putative membrane protein